MIHSDLIKSDVSPVKSTDSVEFALGLFDENKVYHLPVFENGEYMGLVSEGDLLDAFDHENTVKEGSSKLIRIFISEDRHIFDAIKLFSEFKLSILPVLNAKEEYLGYLSPFDIINGMGQMLSIESPGGILILKVNENDFFLSQIVQIVESDDAKILAFYVTSRPDNTQLELTIKINKTDLSAIMQSLSRYEYEVAAAYHQSSDELDLQFRYENFIKYLNI
jgi:acetoin utilization protein AcuB